MTQLEPPHSRRPPPGYATLSTAESTVVVRLGELPAPGPAPQLAPWEPRTGPCRHRSARWHCGGEVAAYCALGLGLGGLVEEHDCNGCGRSAD